MGERFSVADAYLYAIVSWSRFTRIDLSALPAINAFLANVGARPSVVEAERLERARLAA